MIMITKLGHRVQVLRMGVPDADGPTAQVKGIDLDSQERDMFGKRILEEYKLSDFVAIEGSFAFPIKDNK